MHKHKSHSELLTQINEAQQRLIARHPELASFFVPIYLSAFGETVPFLPIRSFRLFSVFSRAADDIRTSFLSSGSTQDVRATHYFTAEGLSTYSRGSIKAFRTFLLRLQLDLKQPILNLIPGPDEWPQSSLSAMMQMLKSNFKIVDATPENFNALFLKTFQNSPQCLVFGTTWHHLSLLNSIGSELRDFIRERSIILIDTGGTKGRTQHFTRPEVQALCSKAYATSVVIVSEYGMCELASQAYSESIFSPERFVCADSLSCYSLSLQKRREETRAPGFLAFIDANNCDSYPAIITEDLAVTLNERCFELRGRAPDASLKGCSLNVKQNFFSLPREPQKILPSPLTDANPRDICALTKALARSVHWDAFARNDLKQSANTLFDSFPAQNFSLQHKRILCIGSANIPIAWLFAARTAAALGAQEFVLQLPSLREEDSLSQRVRAQMTDLVACLLHLFSPMRMRIDATQSELPNGYDITLVFGTDATVDVFRSSFLGQTKIMGLGSVNNMMRLKDEAEVAVSACTSWFGRGCLTPTILSVQNKNPSLLKNFATRFEKSFAERARKAGIDLSSWHAHDRLEIQGRLLSTFSSTDRLMPSEHTTCVDLTELSLEEFKSLQLPLSAGGSGLVFFCSQNLETALKEKGFTFYEPFPQIFDAHCGIPWLERFRELLPY